VDVRIVVPHGLALRVVRFTLLMVAAAGFLTMHGVAATDTTGLHHNPMTMSATSTTDPAHAMADPRSAPVTVASTPDGGSDGHNMAAACLFVLLSVLAAVTLRALYKRPGGTERAALRAIWRRRSPARSPPQPVFLVLCVFRL
jgi:hypothetical protein